MTRVLTALLLIPLVTAVNFHGPPLLVSVVMALVALLSVREFFDISEKLGSRPFHIAGYAAGLVLIIGNPPDVGAYFAGLTILFLLLAINPQHDLSGAFGAVAATLFGVIYICGAFAIGNRLHSAGPHWFFCVLILNWIGDGAAYYVGRAIGRHKMSPRISPNKTWEGAIGSAVFATVAAVAYLHYFLADWVTLWQAALFGLTINVSAQLGDLAESALKRGADVKDSGTLLPGHGGMLDRIDGLLFSMPAGYFFLLFLIG